MFVYQDTEQAITSGQRPHPSLPRMRSHQLFYLFKQLLVSSQTESTNNDNPTTGLPDKHVNKPRHTHAKPLSNQPTPVPHLPSTHPLPIVVKTPPTPPHVAHRSMAGIFFLLGARPVGHPAGWLMSWLAGFASVFAARAKLISTSAPL